MLNFYGMAVIVIHIFNFILITFILLEMGDIHCSPNSHLKLLDETTPIKRLSTT